MLKRVEIPASLWITGRRLVAPNQRQPSLLPSRAGSSPNHLIAQKAKERHAKACRNTGIRTLRLWTQEV